MELEPVGNYAVRIKFDDLHDTGIYSWQYLRFLGENRERALGATISPPSRPRACRAIRAARSTPG